MGKELKIKNTMQEMRGRKNKSGLVKKGSINNKEEEEAPISWDTTASPGQITVSASWGSVTVNPPTVSFETRALIGWGRVVGQEVRSWQTREIDASWQNLSRGEVSAAGLPAPQGGSSQIHIHNTQHTQRPPPFPPHPQGATHFKGKQLHKYQQGHLIF